MKYMFAVVLALTFPAASIAQSGPSGSIGRYVVVHSPQTERSTVLLDTVTGKTWLLVSDISREGDPLAWVPLSRADVAGEVEVFLRRYPIKANRNPKP